MLKLHDFCNRAALIADTPLLRDHLPNIEDYWGLGFCMFRGLGRVAWDVLCSAMVRLHELTDKETDLIARHVIDLLSSVMRNDERTLRIGSSVARSTHLHRIEKYICAHYDKPDLSAAAIARDCGISLRYLHQIFVGTDRSVGQYIRRRRLLEAQRLLKERGELKLADIAYRCGFSDHTALSRYFKREIGITPSEYRAMSGSKALPGYRALSPDHPRSS
jgi:AraC-like DNA-binding protein